jgi:hypothetical protein
VSFTRFPTRACVNPYPSRERRMREVFAERRREPSGAKTDRCRGCQKTGERALTRCSVRPIGNSYPSPLWGRVWGYPTTTDFRRKRFELCPIDTTIRRPDGQSHVRTCDNAALNGGLSVPPLWVRSCWSPAYSISALRAMPPSQTRPSPLSRIHTCPDRISPSAHG